jgi:membrane associated rhomboid family serine protease
MVICPKCGYLRQPKDDDFVSKEECPKCGVVYEKFEKVQRQLNAGKKIIHLKVRRTNWNYFWSAALCLIIFAIYTITPNGLNRSVPSIPNAKSTAQSWQNSNLQPKSFDNFLGTRTTAQPFYNSGSQNMGTVPIAALIILIVTGATSFSAFKNQKITDRYILNPWSIVRNKTRYYTLVSSGLIHANPMHLTMNLMSFTFFALPLEGIIGHAGFVLVYFGSLILSSIVVTIRNGNNASYRCLGASGAISGIIFSYILYRPTATISMMIAPMGVPAPIFALAFVGYSYFMSRTKYDNVAHDAHLWGAITGALLTVIYDPHTLETVTGFLH